MIKNKKLLKNVSFIALTAMTVTGCAGGATQNAGVQLDRANQRASEAMVQSRTQGSDVQTGPTRMRSGVFLAGAVTESSTKENLPNGWANKNVKFVSARPMTFREVADMITDQTGISIVARADIASEANAAAPARATGSADITAPKVAQGPQPIGFNAQEAIAAANEVNAASAGAPAVRATAGTMVVNYDGKLKNFLDRVADSFNYTWTYENGSIQFSRTKVVTFDIPALPMVIKLAFSLDSGLSSSASGDGASQTGGSNQKADTNAAFDIWNDINKTLNNIVGTSGTVNISGSTGTITINAPAVTIRQARDYIKRINAELSRQVVLAVNVYSVQLRQSDNYNFDLNAAFSDGKFAFNAGNSGLVNTAAGLSNAATGVTSGAGYAILSEASKWKGTNGIIQALSSQGDVSTITSANLTTLNGIPAPFQVINTRGYVAEVSTTTNGNSDNTQTTLTPGSVTTGFNLYVVPRVDRSGRVMLQYGINISELVGATGGFDEFSSGGQTVQLPNINARNFVQEAAVPINGTLVITGFEQKTAKTNSSGTGKAKLPLLGGGRNAEAGREMVVITVSPRVISLGTPKAID